MKSFKGFNSNRDLNTEIPPEFFSTVLPNLNDLYEIKTVLYIFWLLEHSEQDYPYITIDQLERDSLFLSGFGNSESEQKINLIEGINHAIKDGILLDPKIVLDQNESNCYFLNSPKGKDAVEMLRNGSLIIEPSDHFTVKLTQSQPNIFKIYEENIGIITPIISDALTAMEESYPINWIEEAIKEAIKNNVRKLRYIEAILKNWQEEGKHERTDRKRGQKDQEEYDPDRYIDGEFSDFIDH